MTVTQLQYTAWPDHDVPKSATPLIEISRTLKSLQGNGKQRVLIHCRSVMSVLHVLNNNYSNPYCFGLRGHVPFTL